MKKIHILSREVSDIIAAGEVVENTASLVKELIENSLDANASKIEIEVNNNARDVFVRDNGDGMSLEDLEICSQRHATSKIKNKDDIFNLLTYGFRGEALSSISSVSRMSIASKQDKGHKVFLDAGNLVGQEFFGMNRGTEVTIENLFFNVPARLKFMRSLDNEYSKIKNIVLKEALANPDVAISLSFDGKIKLKTSGRGIENTIVELFSANTLKELNKFKLGYLGNTNIQRSSRDFIFTFFNKRYAKSALVDKAVMDAFYTRLDKGKYPFVILFLDIDPKIMDVNVHPSKKVIKFTNEGNMYKYVKNEISQALDAIDRTLVTSAIGGNFVNLDRVKIDNTKEIKKFDVDNNSSNFNSNSQNNNFANDAFIGGNKINIDDNKNKTINDVSFKEEIEEFKKLANKKIEDSKQEDYFIDNKFIGQVFRSFSVVECRDRIELYDNHIVQERILYEEIKDKYYNKKVTIQALLVPIKVHLSRSDKDIAIDNLDFFKELGFEIEDFGDRDIVIRAVPAFNLKDSYENIFKDLVDILSRENIKERIKDIREESIITMSCRQSIKAGDNVSNEEMKMLINKLHKLNKYTCPHGRNIIVDLSKSYLEKMFKRH